MGKPRVMIIGLDSVPPRIAFDICEDEMPCLASLRRSGAYGKLRSTIPPVTIPAWVTATCGRDPGELGIYGFRQRRPDSYEMEIVDSRHLAHRRIWDIAAAKGLPCVAVSVPLTYPLAAADGITMTSCFLTPGPHSSWVTPVSRRAELEALFGPYMVDVPDYRADDKERLLMQCRALTAQHFAVFRRLVATSDCDLAMLVDLAPDRLHHGMLASIMPEHPWYDSNGRFVEPCRNYYAELDKEIERTLDLSGPDTVAIVVSDHGVQPLCGGLCVNEWLIREGYLALEETPAKPTPLSGCRVDWSRTRAWGEGGHHCRISFNVAGREPMGIVPRNQLFREREELMGKIRDLRDPSGQPLHNDVFIPQQCYREVNGLPPDLIVYWDDLKLRSIGSVGHGAVHKTGNDTGSDEANHAQDGIIIVDKGRMADNNQEYRIEDLFATSLNALGLDPPLGSLGRSLLA